MKLSSHNLEVIIWIEKSGNVVISDPSIDLWPLINSIGFEEKKNFILTSKHFPNFLRSKEIRIPIRQNDISNMSIEDLWSFHDDIIKGVRRIGKKNTLNFLELKIELVKHLISSCSLCEHRCGVNRLKGEKGICGAGATAKITREFIHIGEEKGLTPSYTIFFAGCNMFCLFCHELSRNSHASIWRPFGPKDIARFSSERFRQGARNVNFVGGEPTIYLLDIIEALTLKNMPAIPIIWNSNMYYTKEVSEILNGVVDIYLADLKFGNNYCARKLSRVNRYWETVISNLKMAKRQRAKVIIRHLPLPGHIECCSIPIFNWLGMEFKGAKVSILEYEPPDNTIPSLKRRLTKGERKILISILEVLKPKPEV
jgi:putative pyruvate formate lyase activating enzyme